MPVGGMISQEVKNHEISCRFRDRLKKMTFEYIPIVGSSNSSSSPTSV